MFVKIINKVIKKVYNREVEIFEPIVINCDNIKSIHYSAQKDWTVITYSNDKDPVFIRGDVAQRIIDAGLPDVKDGGTTTITDSGEDNQGEY